MLGLAQVLPVSVGCGVCVGLARVARLIRPGDRRLAEANLALVFPEWSRANRKQWLRRATDLLGRNLFEALILPRIAAGGFARVEDDGAIAVLDRLRAEGRGVLVLTGHFGCWEMLGAYLAHHLGQLAVVTGTVHNQPVARLLADRRRRLGMEPLPRGGDLRPLLRTLQGGGVVAVLLDQNTRVRSLDVPFCGRPAPTAVGFAKLALRYRVPVLPVAIGRRDGGHRVVHLPPLRPDGRTDAAAVTEFLGACNAALEEFLRRNPAEWVWFHRRWGEGAVPPAAEVGSS